MAESNPIIRYGASSLAAINRTTGLPYGRMRVIGEVAFNLGGELNKLFGGSSLFPWAANPGVLDGTINIKGKEFPPWMSELFMGKAPTDTNSANTTGEVDTIANKKGETVVDASTGIASVGLKSGAAASVRFAAYVVKAVTGTTVDVYGVFDVDFGRETAINFEDDALKITSSPLTITASTATEIPNTGLELTGGSGVIGMTAGDTAVFESRPTYNRKIEMTLPATGLTFPEFKLVIVGERQGEAGLHRMDIFRCKGIGLPRTFSEKAFAETEVNAAVLADASLGVYKEIEIAS